MTPVIARARHRRPVARYPSIPLILGVCLYWAIGDFSRALAQSNPLGGVPVLRISTENTADHVQTRVVQQFAKRLQARLGQSLEVEHSYDARLFRDRDVINALERGLAEMAVPGTWQFDRHVPDVGVLMLPMFYGLGADAHYRLREGRVGARIVRRIEDTLDLVVVGRWIDLGFAHIYSVDRPLRQIADLEGLRIRIPGGRANAARLEALGAEPVVIAWPDVPAFLDRRAIDGLLTTHATIASARLWRHGLRFGLEDRQYFPQYIPIIARRFWRRLPPPVRTAITEVWDRIVPSARDAARKAQAAARDRMVANGMTVSPVDPAAQVRVRQAMAANQSSLAARLGIDPGIVGLSWTQIEDLDRSP